MLLIPTDWNDRRGMVIESVGINSISYDEDSKNLINLRNKGAMLSDATVREGYVQGSVAEGIKACLLYTSSPRRGWWGRRTARNSPPGRASAPGRPWRRPRR